jgi:hypothetical protein
VGKVESGAKLVNTAGATMGDIVKAVGGVTEIIAQIAAASAEQSSGIEQVNLAITQMDQVTQQNAALVEEAAAAAGSMEAQAGALAQSVSVFRIHPEAKPAQSPRTPSAPLVERRGPNRAKNVARLPAQQERVKPAPPRTKAIPATGAGEDDWAEF